MAGQIDDISLLSETIGPRPAGTEEEQQAALHIAEELQQSAGFPTIIEDFKCVPNQNIVKIICFGVAFIAALLSVIVPAAALPAFIIGALAAALFMAEIFGRPFLSSVLRSGVSQNVVAKYQPGGVNTSGRSRKVILVANYDSGKTITPFEKILGKNFSTAYLVAAGALVAAPVFQLIHILFFFSATGAPVVVFNVLTIICLIAMAFPLLVSIAAQVMPYNSAANNNAAGAAVLLDVARTVGNGLVSAEELEELSQEGKTHIHGEAEARKAGVIPEGAEIEYETSGEPVMSKEESLAAAKAAIAALTGRPVADKVPLTDISSKLVHPGQSNDVAVRFETEDGPSSAARRQVEEQVREHARQAASAEQAQQEAINQVEDQAHATTESASESFIKESPAAIHQSAPVISIPANDGIPSWAKAAQAKAHANKPELSQSAKPARSRFADTVAAQITDAQLHNTTPDVTGSQTDSEQMPSEEKPATVPAYQPPDRPMSELEARIAELQAQIDAAAANTPHLSEQAKEAFAQMGEQEQAAKLSVQDEETTPKQDFVKDQSSESKATTAQPQAEADQAIEADKLEPKAKPLVVSASSGQPGKTVSEKETEEATGEAAVDKTQAISPIDVSSLLDKKQPTTKAELSKEKDHASDQAAEKPRVTINRAAPIVGVAQTAAPTAKQTAAQSSVAKEQPVNNNLSPEEIENLETTPVALEEIQEAIEKATENIPERPATPILGMEEMASRLPSIVDSSDAVEDGEEKERQVIVLPDVAAVHDASEATKQRAPMADTTEDTRAGAKALLSNMLPRIDGDSLGPISSVSHPEEDSTQTPLVDLPSFDHTEEQSAVSATSSFATAGGTGTFAPITDDLIADVAPEERYVDDADDSSFDEEHTETGAFAGPGYVEMPRSRAGRFFGKFRSKKKEQEEGSVREWVGADENYEARSVGKARGSWESFRDNDEAEFIDVDFSDDSFDNPRGWNGGAFSLGRLAEKLPRSRKKQAEEAEEIEEYIDEEIQEAVLRDGSGFVTASSADALQDQAKLHKEISRLNNFRHPGIDTEVWFVALGATQTNNGGMAAFIEEHKEELKGSIIINLEALGEGKLTFLQREGIYRKKNVSSRMKRLLRNASEASGVPFATGEFSMRDTPAAYAMKQGFTAMTLAGMDGSNMAYYGQADDTIDNIDEEILSQNTAFVMELLKTI